MAQGRQGRSRTAGRSSTAGRSRRRWGALALAATLGLGCGPVTAASTVGDAERDLGEAESLKARDRAPYEYTRARTLLEKAKECEGYGAFERASGLARQSRVMSEKAIDVARLAAEREKRDEKFGRRRAPGASSDGSGGDGTNKEGSDRGGGGQ